METKCKYLALMAVIKEEYYIVNHLVLQGDSPYELFERAKEYAHDELDEITDNCTLRGENTQYNIDLLMGRASEEDDEPQEEDFDSDDSTLTEEQRQAYYDYRFKPIKPNRSSSTPYGRKLESKPSLITFWIRRAWKLALSVVMSLVLLAIGQMVGCGVVNSKSDIGVQDTVWTSTHIVLASTIDKENGVEEIVWLEKSPKGYAWGMISLLPLLVWLITSVIRIKSTQKERDEVQTRNNHLKQQYAKAMEAYRIKPTDRQMEEFTMGFLSEIVDIELRFHGKSEEDLKGRTLFLNEYFDYKEDGPNYENSAIEYKIILLEESCVSVISSDWRIYEDMSDTGTIESISYADIKEVRLSEDVLSFGGINIELPQEQVFEYQDSDPSDELTFSIFCTSDVRQFALALRKLHMAYKTKH